MSRRGTPKTWTGRVSPDDILNPDQCSEALRKENGKITAQGIRMAVRRGRLPRQIIPQVPDMIFVKRSDLMKVYDERINGWRGMKRGRA